MNNESANIPFLVETLPGEDIGLKTAKTTSKDGIETYGHPLLVSEGMWSGANPCQPWYSWQSGEHGK